MQEQNDITRQQPASPKEAGISRADELNKRIRKQMRDLFVKAGIRNTTHRRQILDVFLSTDNHLTVTEIERRLRAQTSDVTSDTIERTMQLLCEMGLAEHREFEGREPVYEHRHIGEHHDHFICTKCGKIEEFRSEEIERLQDTVALRHGFRALRHKLELYGLCSSCFGAETRSFPLANAPIGELVCVVDIDGGLGARGGVSEMGLNPGTELEVLGNVGMGKMVLRVGERRIAVGRGIAQKVMVKRA